MESNTDPEVSYARRTVIILAVIAAAFVAVGIWYGARQPDQERARQERLYNAITNSVVGALKGERPVGFVEPMQLQPQIRANNTIAFDGWLKVDGGTNGPQMRWFSVTLKEAALTNATLEIRSVQVYTNEPKKF